VRPPGRTAAKGHRLRRPAADRPRRLRMLSRRTVGVRTTSDLFENLSDDDEQWLADIETRTINLEHELSEWREARQRALAEDDYGVDDGAMPMDYPVQPTAGRAGRAHHDRRASSIHPASVYPAETAAPHTGRRPRQTEDRTRTLIDHGRRSARRVRRPRGRTSTLSMIILAVTGAILLVLVFRHSASWPSSVATVQNEITTACQNPDVASEPNQVNFACDKSTSQILWVFALMTSGNNPAFTDAKSGRQGLEPITPTQGGDVAWSLNLHHPYNPLNPVDSLEVAARAINNIIGGASVTGSNGKPTVQPGLESSPANCARYTGSAAMISRAGFPDICAQPVSSTGQAALVSDVYQQWLVGSPPVAAQEAGVLFENSDNPGNPSVQAILKTLPVSSG
jgi:hypothetical protein